jgi:hypothetical protein
LTSPDVAVIEEPLAPPFLIHRPFSIEPSGRILAIQTQTAERSSVVIRGIFFAASFFESPSLSDELSEVELPSDDAAFLVTLLPWGLLLGFGDNPSSSSDKANSSRGLDFLAVAFLRAGTFAAGTFASSQDEANTSSFHLQKKVTRARSVFASLPRTRSRGAIR